MVWRAHLLQRATRHACSIFNLLMELDFLIAPLSLSVITNSRLLWKRNKKIIQKAPQNTIVTRVIYTACPVRLFPSPTIKILRREKSDRTHCIYILSYECIYMWDFTISIIENSFRYCIQIWSENCNTKERSSRQNRGFKTTLAFRNEGLPRTPFEWNYPSHW